MRARSTRAKDETGRWGEEVAARYLVAAGLTLLDRNWRCDAGELDLVAREGPAIVFCEVKTRSSTKYGEPAEAVLGRKAAKVRELAWRWLGDHPGTHAPDLRFDVVSIVRNIGSQPTLQHLRDAF